MADAARIKYEQICPDCRGSDFVENFSEGDLVCTVLRPGHLVPHSFSWPFGCSENNFQLVQSDGNDMYDVKRCPCPEVS